MPTVLDLDKLRQAHSANIQRIAFIVGMTQAIKGDERLTTYLVEPNPTGMTLDHLPPGLSPEQIADGRHMLAQWSLAQGLRDLVEGLEDILTAPFRLGIAARVGQGSLTPGDADALLRRFLTGGLIIKANFLRDELNIELPCRREFASLNDLRNCLAHRRGMVGPEDCRNQPGFTLRWLGFDVIFQGDDGTEKPLVLGELIEQAGQIAIKFADRERTYLLGQRLELESHMLSELLFMFDQAGKTVIGQISGRLEQFGVQNVAPAADRFG